MEKKKENEAAAEKPVVVFKNGKFHTPDGSCFNTQLKAEKHLKSLNND
jgi:hypothetical protein